jgi:large subunit ribosomal protein L41
MPIDKRGVRDNGVYRNGTFKWVQEMNPELIVPDLTDCKFKPYVSYKAADVIQSRFTSQDLFNAVYAQKIIDDFKQDKLNGDGSSKNPSSSEEMTEQEAWEKARKTGSDMF